MKLKQLLNDDSGVSPVIGVILMVAITVILAAVIATFVLGLGEQVSDTTPNANFQGEWVGNGSYTAPDASGSQDTATILEITHTSGPTIESGSLSLAGDVNNVSINTTYSSIDPGTEDMSAGDTLVVVGNSTAPLSEGDQIRLRWENSQGDTAILRTFEAPEDFST